MNHSGAILKTCIKGYVLLFSLLFLLNTSAHAVTVYIDVNSSVNGPGDKWSNAYNDINTAFDVIEGASNVDEVWIADGDYIVNPDGNNFSFNINNDIKILGGFAGDELNQNQRDWVANRTVINFNGITEKGFGFGAGLELHFDALTFTRAGKVLSSGEESIINLKANTKLTVTNCTFLQNDVVPGGAYQLIRSLATNNEINIINTFFSANAFVGPLVNLGPSCIMKMTNVTTHANQVDNILFTAGNGVACTIANSLFVDDNISVNSAFVGPSGTTISLVNDIFDYASVNDISQLTSPTISVLSPTTIVNPTNLDFTVNAGQNLFNYDTGSDGIDAGDLSYYTNAMVGITVPDPNYDLRHVARVKGTIDIGAFEFQAFTCPSSSQVYVDENAPANGDGIAWGTAYQDLQTALDHANYCIANTMNPVKTINIAEGIYVPNNINGFELIDAVRIIGGYQTGGSAIPDPNTFMTTISGDLASDDNTSFTNIVDNAMHVFYSNSGLTGTATELINLNISGGIADDAAPNNRGGGILVQGGRIKISNCNFSFNMAQFGGGAVYINGNGGSSLTTIEDCEFTDNAVIGLLAPLETVKGGAVRGDNGHFTIRDSRFLNNKIEGGNTNSAGGAVHLSGGGVSEEGLIDGCYFKGNTCVNGYGGAVNMDRYNTFTTSSRGEVSNCKFYTNSAENGGALNGEYISTIYVFNNIFAGNTATTKGGAFFSLSNQGGEQEYRFMNNVFYNNTAVNGANAAFFNQEIATGESGIFNSIFFGNVTGTVVETDQTDPVLISNSLYNGNVNDDVIETANVIGNPLFVNALGADNIAYTEDDDYHLSVGSPAIGIGVIFDAPFGGSWEGEEEDFEGNIYGQDVEYDAGAFEFMALDLTLHYVNGNVVGGLRDGSSWANAYVDLQNALNAADAKDTVVVATGTYVPGVPMDLDGNTIIEPQEATFQIPNQVKLWGSFTAGDDIRSQTVRDNRDFNSNSSVLDGENTSYHVLFTSEVDNTTEIDGFYIVRGNASGTTTNHTDGGGLLIRVTTGSAAMDNFGPSLSNLSFIENMASVRGGGISVRGASGKSFNTSWSNCLFDNNSADTEGGAVAFSTLSATSEVSITNSTFDNNSSGTNGGGIFISSVLGTALKVSISNCLFNDNVASINGSAIRSASGLNSDHTLEIKNSTFAHNDLVGGVNGAAIYTTLATLLPVSNSTTISNSIFWKNNLSGFSKTFETADGATIEVDYSLIGDETEVEVNATVGVALGTNNLYVFDPLFTDENTNDFTLQIGSPAIDEGTTVTGLPSTDLAGEPRIFNGDLDLGAFESQTLCDPLLVTETTDGTTCGTLRNAIDFANSNTSSRDTIRFRIDGTDAIVLESPLPTISIALTIDGKDIEPTAEQPIKSIIYQPAPLASRSHIFGASVPFTLKNINVNGNDEAELIIHVDHIQSSYASVIDSVTFFGADKHAISKTSNGTLLVNHSDFYNNKSTSISSSGGTTVRNSLIGVNGSRALQTRGVLLGGVNEVIDSCTIANHDSEGIRLSTATNPTINKNTIQNNNIGILSLNQTAGSITKNNIGLTTTGEFATGIGNDSVGVLISTNVTNLTISDNQIGQSGKQGIFVLNPGNTLNIIDNTIGVDALGAAASNGASGILLSSALGTSFGGQISGNIIGNNGTRGIHIANVSNYSIHDNLIGVDASGGDIGNAKAGVELSNGSIANFGSTGSENVIGFNGESGIVIKDASTGPISITSFIGTNATGANYGNTGAGILMNNTSNVTISESVIAYNDSSGVVFTNGSTNNTIDNTNSIHSNGNKGIRIDNSQNNVTTPNFTDFSNDVLTVNAPSGSGFSVSSLDIFMDNGGEGEVFLGQATGSGSLFTLDVSTLPDYQTNLTNGFNFFTAFQTSTNGVITVSSEFSDSVSAIASIEAPDTVCAFAGNEQVDVEWTAVSGVTAYDVIYTTTATDTISATAVFTPINVTSGTSTNVTGLANDIIHYFAVVSMGGDTSNWAAAVPVIEAGNALSFDGTNYVDLSSDENLPVGDSPRTVEAWVKYDPEAIDPGEVWTIFTYGASVNNQRLRIAINENGLPTVGVRAYVTEVMGFTPEADTWYHFAYSYGGGDVEDGDFYINGVQYGLTFWEGTAGPTVNTVLDGVAQIGARQGDIRFEGEIDEVRVWDVARTATEITANKDVPLLGNEEGLLGLWHFDEPSGTIAYDASCNGNHGTLINAPDFVDSRALHPFAVSTLTGNRVNGVNLLTWESGISTDIVAYNIYRNINDVPDTVEVHAGPTTDLVFNDPDVNSCDTAYYLIVPVDSNGQLGHIADTLKMYPNSYDFLTVSNTLDDGTCGTLRAAIETANLIGKDTITFAPSMLGETIILDDILPNLTDAGTVINGLIDADTISDITIDGSGITNLNQFIIGLNVVTDADEVVIRGLTIQNMPRGNPGAPNNFDLTGVGIQLFDSPSNVVIENNVLLSNEGAGIAITSSTNPSFVRNNVVYENGLGGPNPNNIAINGSSGATVENNRIGMDGIDVEVRGVSIFGSGSNTITGNEIGNVWTGILLGGTSSNLIESNFIGIDETGTIFNLDTGVVISDFGNPSLSNSIINNTITNSNITGIIVDGATSTGNLLSINSIYGNTGLGIDLTNGSNDNVQAPVISSLSPSLEVVGAIPSGTYATTDSIFVFADLEDEGQVFLASTLAQENWAVTIDTTGLGAQNLNFITALLNVSNNTSEFSSAFEIDICNPLIVSKRTDSPVSVCGELRYAIDYGNDHFGSDTITFSNDLNHVDSVITITQGNFVIENTEVTDIGRLYIDASGIDTLIWSLDVMISGNPLIEAKEGFLIEEVDVQLNNNVEQVINVSVDADTAIFIRNRFSDVQSGISVSTPAYFESNIFRNLGGIASIGTGIEIADDGENSVILGNRINVINGGNILEFGILVQGESTQIGDTTNLLLSTNYIGYSKVGISLQSEQNEVFANHIGTGIARIASFPNEIGIDIVGEQFNVIAGNVIFNSTLYGINVNAPNNGIGANIIWNNTTAGVNVTGVLANNVVVSENSFNGNGAGIVNQTNSQNNLKTFIFTNISFDRDTRELTVDLDEGTLDDGVLEIYAYSASDAGALQGLQTIGEIFLDLDGQGTYTFTEDELDIILAAESDSTLTFLFRDTQDPLASTSEFFETYRLNFCSITTDAGIDQSLCKGDDQIELSGTIDPVSILGGLWSVDEENYTKDGSFSLLGDPIIYTLGPVDKQQDSISFIFTPIDLISGCTIVPDTMVVYLNDLPEVNIQNTTGLCDTNYFLTTDRGEIVDWFAGTDTTIASLASSIEVQLDAPGTYTAVVDSLGCRNLATVNLTLPLRTPADTSMVLSDNGNICESSIGVVNLNPSVTTDFDVLTWYTRTFGTDVVFVQATEASSTAQGDYFFVKTDANNCSDTSSVVTIVDDCSNIPMAKDTLIDGVQNIELIFNPTEFDTDPNNIPLDLTTIDLDPSTVDVQSNITTTDGDWNVDASGILTFTPATDFVGNAIITYTINNNNGLVSNTATITVNVLSDPCAVLDMGAIAITGTNICEGTLSLSAPLVTGVSYQWSFETTSNLIIGATNESYSAIVEGKYFVNYTGACTGNLEADVVYGETPSINDVSGVYQIAVLANSYQWYAELPDGDRAIVGETGNSYEPIFDGVYYALVTYDGCNLSTNKITKSGSGNGSIFKAGLEMSDDEIWIPSISEVVAKLNVYPNPTFGSEVNVEFTSLNKEPIQVTLSTLDGRLLFSEVQVHGGLSTSLRFPEIEFDKGVYLISVEQSGKTYLERIIIY